MEQQIDINKIFQIIGRKEIEMEILRERIQQLEQEKESKPLKTDPVE